MFYICLFRNYVINVQPLNIQRVKFLENSTNSQSYALQRSGKLPSNKEKLIFYNFCFTLTDISVSGVTLLAQMWFKMHGTIKVLYKVKSHSLLNAQNWIIRPTDGYDWRVWCPCHTPSKIGLIKVTKKHSVPSTIKCAHFKSIKQKGFIVCFEFFFKRIQQYSPATY